ncbi:N-acetyltransferase DgcN [Emcibacter sp.]|uniref:N-acetyltransferase DgcN n=1 Tax=Emcibacter sp. TaxID=1979954 RepID=UPI002AA5F74A|nr:N-acetyltransferase DgcN [Emcibacter sp.]
MKQPYLLFLGNEKILQNAKTASGIAHWRPEICAGQYRMSPDTTDLGLRNMNIDEAVAQGAKTLVVGIAPVGGIISRDWVPVFLEALDKGLDIAAGLHQRLNDHPEISQKARACGRDLYDIRQPTEDFEVGNGAKRPGRRLLTVGSDCAVGKMYTSLAIEREMRERGMNADFRATGQTGIFIAGGGVSVDAVVADFISGAAESLSPGNSAGHWDIVEGQGSLFHPSYAGVTVGLIHGSQPDRLVLCHDAARQYMEDVQDFPIVEFNTAMEQYLNIARLTNREASFAGISINTSSMVEQEAERYLNALTDKYGLPCCDPVRNGVSAIVDNLEG